MLKRQGHSYPAAVELAHAEPDPPQVRVMTMEFQRDTAVLGRTGHRGVARRHQRTQRPYPASVLDVTVAPRNTGGDAGAAGDLCMAGGCAITRPLQQRAGVAVLSRPSGLREADALVEGPNQMPDRMALATD